MATTTPNYGWPVPTSTDLVKDGATAIEALGDAIDATVFGLPSAALSLISTTTIGTAVTSVNVTGAFSATYDAYKIIIGGTGVVSSPVYLNLKLGASTTGYYSAGYNNTYAGTGGALGTNNTTTFQYSGLGTTNYLNFNVDLINPASATYTQYIGGFNNTTLSSFQTGMHQVATAYTDFTISVASGTITGGTIYVYGYAKA